MQRIAPAKRFTFRSLSKALDARLQTFFFDLGFKVSHNPWSTIGACLVVTLICMLGFLNFELESNDDVLYTPQDARSFTDKEYVERVWDQGIRVNSIYVQALPVGSSILTSEALLRLLDVHELVTTYQITYSGDTIGLSDLCLHTVGPNCSIRSVLDLFQYNRTLIASLTDLDILAAVNQPAPTDVEGQPLAVDVFLGGVVRSAGGEVESAQAAGITFLLNNVETERAGERDDYRARAWEIALKDGVFGVATDGLIRVYLLTQGGQDVVADDAISADVGLLPMGFTLMIIYALLILSRQNKVKSQTNLAFLSVVVVLLSTFAGFGIAAVFIKFSLVVQAALPLLFGIGIDDRYQKVFLQINPGSQNKRTFVILSAFRQTDASDDPHIRVAKAMKHAGGAITVTSLTDVCAFIAGSFSSINAIQTFCIYSACGIFVDYIFQVTFFVAILSLDTRRMANRRMDCLCCITASQDSAESNCISGKRFDETKPDGPIITKLLDLLSRFVLYPPAQVLVLATAVLFFGGGLYGALNLGTEFSLDWFIPDDGNYIREAIDLRDNLFSEVDRPVVLRIFTKEGDYFAAIPELEAMSAQIPFIARYIPETQVNWFRAFENWLEINNNTVAAPINSATFISTLLDFLTSSEGARFHDLVKFNPNNSSIISTAIRLTVGQETSASLIEAMDSTREVAALCPSLNTITFQEFFVFMDGLKIIDEELQKNLILAGAAVLFICIILLANLSAAILVAVVLAAIDIEVLGFVYFLGMQYNPVTVINSLVSVGIAVDYNVHIVHTFLGIAGVSRAARVRSTIESIGGPVLTGGVSTFLAISVLAFSASYIFRVFFRLISAIILFSMFHGLLVVPAVLSIAGPAAYEDASESKTSHAAESEIEMTPS